MFPPTAPIAKLNQEHPDYSFYKEAWDQVGTLYAGGVRMREAVMRSGQFLRKNPKELPEVFNVRQQNFSYTNLLGNVIGWYMAALFKLQPQLVKKLDGTEGEDAQNIPQDVADFCEQLEKDCDCAGTTFVDFFRTVAEACVLYRCAYVLLDLPSPIETDDASPPSLQQQKQEGLLDPFLVLYKPSEVINWETDSHGNLEWIQIKIRVQEQGFLEDPSVTDYWYYFDRQQVALYERPLKVEQGKAQEGGDEEATLCAGYPRRHAMADQDRVPVHKVCLPDGLWLANRVFLPLINHLNQDNALDFGLMQANLPQLVIEDGPNGGYEEPVTISAVGYHKLPNGGKMYYLEPGGVAFEAAQKRIDALEERIYKACYLMDQARSNRSTPSAQSGLSKQQDKTPSRDALSGIGDVLRPAMQAVYKDMLTIAGHEGIEPDVRGFDFADKATADDMQRLEQGSVIEVNSETYEREIAKTTVRLVLPDANPETLEKIDQEIEDNPTPSALAAQQQEEQKQAMQGKFLAGLNGNGADQLPAA